VYSLTAYLPLLGVFAAFLPNLHDRPPEIESELAHVRADE
jgi:hypothetical protein